MTPLKKCLLMLLWFWSTAPALFAQTLPPAKANKDWHIVIVSNMPPDASGTVHAAMNARITQSLAKTDIRAKSTLVVMAYGDSVAETIAQALRAKPDILVVMAASLATEARTQAPQVPIVFKTVFDPVATGLVETAIKPGRNMTGYTNHGAIDEKRWEMITQAAANVRRIGVLLNQTYYKKISAQLPMTLPGGVEVVLLKWQPDEGIAKLEKLIRSSGVQALDVGRGVVKPAEAPALIQLALAMKIPTMFYERWYVQHGGLLSYEAIELDRVKVFSDYVLEILHGSRAGDLPISYPKMFSTSINARTAKALNIRPPTAFLKRIDFWEQE